MKLYVTFTSPYARLARMLVAEKGLEDRVEIVEAKTRTPGSPYYRDQPLGARALPRRRCRCRHGGQPGHLRLPGRPRRQAPLASVAGPRLVLPTARGQGAQHVRGHTRVGARDAPARERALADHTGARGGAEPAMAEISRPRWTSPDAGRAEHGPAGPCHRYRLRAHARPWRPHHRPSPARRLARPHLRPAFDTSDGSALMVAKRWDDPHGSIGGRGEAGCALARPLGSTGRRCWCRRPHVAELVRAYSKSGRHYHTLDHIAALGHRAPISTVKGSPIAALSSWRSSFTISSMSPPARTTRPRAPRWPARD